MFKTLTPKEADRIHNYDNYRSCVILYQEELNPMVSFISTNSPLDSLVNSFDIYNVDRLVAKVDNVNIDYYMCYIICTNEDSRRFIEFLKKYEISLDKARVCILNKAIFNDQKSSDLKFHDIFVYSPITESYESVFAYEHLIYEVDERGQFSGVGLDIFSKWSDYLDSSTRIDRSWYCWLGHSRLGIRKGVTRSVLNSIMSWLKPHSETESTKCELEDDTKTIDISEFLARDR